MRIENGWRLSSADFSMQAAGKSEVGSVMLVRSPEYKAQWHRLNDDLKDSDDCPELYITGTGSNIYEAIINANRNAAQAKDIK